jgi:ABC-2 type transport system permease protein
MSENEKVSTHRLHGIWALTNRELKKWYKAPVVFLLTIIQPILWMGLLGKAMNIGAIFSSGTIPTGVFGSLTPPLTAIQMGQLSHVFSGISSSIMTSAFGVSDYFSYMAMGMIVFTTLFTTAFSGMSVVWDRRLGFMNKVLSTPVSRSVIILSKVLSATLRSLFQAAIVIGIAVIFGLQFGTNFSILSLMGVFAIVFLIGVGLSSLFIAINLRATRMETPQAIINLITLPLMFASNAFFPINLMPNWLQAVANANPMSYTTDAVRRLTIFSGGLDKLTFDFAYVGIFAAVVTAISIILSWRYLNK